MSYDVTLAEKFFFFNLITSMKEVLRIWGSRGLTLTGRIQIFKSIALYKMAPSYTLQDIMAWLSLIKSRPIKFVTERFHLEGPPS